MDKRSLSAALAVVAVTLSMVSWMPAADAHYCHASDRTFCDPNGCRSGANHDHTYRRGTEYERCKSYAPHGSECRIYEWEVPRIVCDILPPPRDALLLA